MAYPAPAYPDRYQYQTQVSFGGYDHRRAPGAYSKRLNNAYRMDWWDAENLTTDYLPVFGVRDRHFMYGGFDGYHGMIGWDDLFIAKEYTLDQVTHTRLYRNDTYGFAAVGDDLTNTDKIMAFLGDRLIIFPDKICYTYGSAQPKWEALENTSAFLTGAIHFSGTYEGEPATANCIYIPSGIGAYRKDQAVKLISTGRPENNKEHAIIREVEVYDPTNPAAGVLHFYDNTFTFKEEDQDMARVPLPNGETETKDGYSSDLRIERNVPDLDILFTHENRLWGAKGDTIYASALGDPFTWYNFDTVDTASWSVDVMDEGDFTGGCSFLGYPIFFKENHIYKVYGSVPSEYSLVQSADLGVEAGSGKSLAIAGEKLYYLSRAGVCVYSGALPQVISQPLGDIRYHNASAGSDGLKYYISMVRPDIPGQKRRTFIYDTQTGLWQTDDLRAYDFAWYKGGLWAVTDNKYKDATQPPATGDYLVWFLSHEDDKWIGPNFSEVQHWNAETFAITETSPLRKWVGASLEVRAELQGGDGETESGFCVFIKYNDSSTWESIGKFYTTDSTWATTYLNDTQVRSVSDIQVVNAGMRSFIIPLIPSRTDYYGLKICGFGKVWIYSIAPQTEQGSSWHGINGGD